MASSIGTTARSHQPKLPSHRRIAATTVSTTTKLRGLWKLKNTRSAVHSDGSGGLVLKSCTLIPLPRGVLLDGGDELEDRAGPVLHQRAGHGRGRQVVAALHGLAD